MAAISPDSDAGSGGDEAPAAPRRFRVSMRTLMIFVLAAAVASALFIELARPFKAKSLTTWAIDVPTIVLLGIALNAVALGCWLRISPDRVLVQFTLCCLLVLGGVWLWQSKFDRGLLYWLQISFAVVVVVPLAGRAMLTRDEIRQARDRRIAVGVNDLLLSYAGFVMFLIMATFQTLILAFLFSIR